MLGQSQGHKERFSFTHTVLWKFQLLQGALFSILMDINLTEKFIMNSSLLAGDRTNAFGGLQKWRLHRWRNPFPYILSKYKPCLQSCNQGRKYSLPGMMILLFLEVMHMDKSEYNYSRGVGIKGNFSFTIPFFLCISGNALKFSTNNQENNKAVDVYGKRRTQCTTVKRINGF